MIGSAPNIDIFKDYFDWEHTVIPMKFDEPNIQEFIAELDKQPKFLNSISQNNTRNSLLKHDWLYRWQQVMQRLELTPNPKAINREARLKELANSVLCQAS